MIMNLQVNTILISGKKELYNWTMLISQFINSVKMAVKILKKKKLTSDCLIEPTQIIFLIYFLQSVTSWLSNYLNAF